jgi:hypothetical protein
MEELTILRDDGLFPKTVVVMQPERSDQEGTQHSRSWEFYRTKLVSMGFNLPAYQRKGLAYLPGEDLSARTLLADDLTGEFSESLRGAVVAALERRRSFVPVRVALPAILSGEAVATREVENARVEEHFAETLRRPRSGVLPTLVTLYADPANALARYRMLSNLQRAAVVVSAIVAVLSLVAVLERTGTMHYWYESIRLIAFAAVSSVGFFIFGIIVGGCFERSIYYRRVRDVLVSIHVLAFVHGFDWSHPGDLGWRRLQLVSWLDVGRYDFDGGDIQEPSRFRQCSSLNDDVCVWFGRATRSRGPSGEQRIPQCTARPGVRCRADPGAVSSVQPNRTCRRPRATDAACFSEIPPGIVGPCLSSAVLGSRVRARARRNPGLAERAPGDTCRR